MDPLLSRKHNSYSEAFTSYLANALKSKDQTDALATIVRYPYIDTTIHLHRLMSRGAPFVGEVNGYVVFKFNSGTEGITMLYLSPDNVRHFAPLVVGGSQLNRDLVDRMIDLLPEQVHVGIGAESWPTLRTIFLQHLYGQSSS